MAAQIYRGGPFFMKPWLREYALAAQTAASAANQTGGTPIKAAFTIFGTVGGAGYSATLPPTVASVTSGSSRSARGTGLVIINLGANTMAIFPAVGDKIDGLATNASISLQANSMVTLTCASVNNWYSTYSGFGGASASAQTNVAASPGSISSTTMQMVGLAGAITPVVTGRILFTISGDVTQSTTADGAKWQLSYGTGSAPANAATLTGTQVGPNPTMTFLTGILTVPFSTQVVVSGLTRGTAYWLDLALAAVTGGAASVSNVSVSAAEF